MRRLGGPLACAQPVGGQRREGLAKGSKPDEAILCGMSSAESAVARPVQTGGEGTGCEAGGSWLTRSLKLALAVGLLPLCLGLAGGFGDHFWSVGLRTHIAASGLPVNLKWFLGGAVLFALTAALLWRPVTVYVFGHELVHALATWACLGKVGNLQASASGGRVSTSKSNTLIRLAPYFVPLYTAAAAGVFAGLNAWWRPLGEYRWLLAFLLGFTLAFHVGFTLWSLHRGQPDLKADGWFFSLVVVFLVNVLVFAAVAGLALSGHWRGAWKALEDVALNAWHHCRTIYSGIFDLARQALGR